MRNRLALLTCVLLGACSYTDLPDRSDAGSVLQRSIFRGQIISHEVVDGWAIAQGDVILGRVDRLERADSDALARRSELVATNRALNTWPGGVIPYEIAPNTPHADWIASGVSHVNTQLSGTIRWIPRTNEADYVLFQTADRCAAHIGRVGGVQAIWVGQTACANPGAVIHEMGHAIGAYHEHNRIDRDSHIRVLWQNIIAGGASEFEKTGESAGTDIGPYDYASIMHYGAYAGSANGLPTLETIPPGIPIGGGTGLSPGDLAAFRTLYGGSPGGGPTVTPPSITSQPQAATVSAGATATFFVGASGAAPLSYQWYRAGSPLVGQSGAQLVLGNVQAAQAGLYWAVVSNSAGTAETVHVMLTVNSAPPPPPPPPTGGSTPITPGVPVTGIFGAAGASLRYVVTVPQGATRVDLRISGGTGDADLYVSYGAPPSTSQFECRPYIDGNDEGCTDTAPQAGEYYVLIHGYSPFAGVTLLATVGSGTTPPTGVPPTISVQPQGAFVPLGSSHLFQVVAGGTAPLSYQWFHDGAAIPGATSAQLGLNAVQASQTGSYFCRVTNPAGFADSLPAQLIVGSAPTPGSGVLANGVPVDVGGPLNSELHYTFEVPPNATFLSFRMSGGSGDSDLYVRYAAPVVGRVADCISGSPTNDEACIGQFPPAGTYHVMVHAYSAFAGARLTASYTTPGIPTPTPSNGMSLTSTIEDAGPTRTVKLQWSGVPGAEYYAVYRDGAWVGVAFFAPSFADTFLPLSFTHTYQVFAIFGAQRVAATPLVTVSR